MILKRLAQSSRPFMPPSTHDVLDDLVQLYALLHDILHATNTPEVGELRLSWWREVIEGKRREEALGAPQAQVWLGYIEKNPMLKPKLFALFEVWGERLYAQPFETFADMKEHASIAYGVWFEVLVPAQGMTFKKPDFLQKCGQALGLLCLLDEFAYALRGGQFLLPTQEPSWPFLDVKSHLNGRHSEALSTSWLKVCDDIEQTLNEILSELNGSKERMSLVQLAWLQNVLPQIKALQKSPMTLVARKRPLRELMSLFFYALKA